MYPIPSEWPRIRLPELEYIEESIKNNVFSEIRFKMKEIGYSEE